MALLTCPECGKAVSSSATICPHCGYPVQKIIDAGLASIQSSNQSVLGGNTTTSQPVFSGNAAPSLEGGRGESLSPRRSNGIGIAGFVLGLIAMLLCWLPIVGQILALVGLILSIIGVCRKPRILAILGLVFSLLSFLFTFLMVSNVIDGLSNSSFQYYNMGNDPNSYDYNVPVDTIPMPDQDFYDNLPPDTTIYVY